MTTVDEHLAAVLDQITPVREVTLPLAQAYGLVLTQDVTSPVDLPRFANSAMDGYAVRAADVAGASPESPKLVPVAGDIPAGDGEGHTLGEGMTWRIMTGAPMPEGADAIVKVEDTDGHSHEVLISASVEPGTHVRRAGEDVRAGERILSAGSRIGPAQVAVLASAGVAEVTVRDAVRVVVLSTGDELVPVGEPVGPGQIHDSNGPMLAALVRAAGHYTTHVGHLPDDEKSIKKELDHHLTSADLVITSGGVSKGAYDAVKAVLTGAGSMEFTEVDMQPGKPQGFGLLGRRKVPVFTLPGNPVSVLVSFEVFVRPALSRLSEQRYEQVTVPAVVLSGWTSPAGRQQYHRVRLLRDVSGAYAAEPAGGPGSHLVAGLAVADGLAIVPAEESEVLTGSQVQVLPLRPLWEIEAELAQESATDQDGAQGAGSEAGRPRGRHRGAS
ncbi:molybdotransferase-like divisome protein Glp [Ornithinimicrobium cryptoxanthini]|uniref:molybdotransferase-like divisome protein Glp n=1 Tax=Ornithinimicrobium cryptoxanthini TaxID=2934161 RepID=UPI0021183CC3|nr:gephyrin-like molybdotransferase Glp [Ornithinimicrobium cryptoxanthini]